MIRQAKRDLRKQPCREKGRQGGKSSGKGWMWAVRRRKGQNGGAEGKTYFGVP